jgi:hypothetical protein
LFGEWAEVTQRVAGETEKQRVEHEAAIDPTLFWPTHDGIHAATMAIVTSGAAQLEEQLTLS